MNDNILNCPKCRLVVPGYPLGQCPHCGFAVGDPIPDEIGEARRLAAEADGNAVRAISDKTRWDWMPWLALHEVAMVFTVCQSNHPDSPGDRHSKGIGKYPPNNWISGTG